MLKNIKKDNKGFTIIEVLIVLAIAGLIMLIVFLAVPALQRNSRNTQRKSDVSNILGGISEFNTNKNGKMPGAYDIATGEYKVAATDTAGSGVKPNMGYYQVGDVTFATNNTAITFTSPITSAEGSKVYVNVGGNCNTTGDNVGGTAATSRSVALVYIIEASGGLKSVCQNS